MTRRMDWRKARLHGKPSLNHQYEFSEFRVRDAADRWLMRCFQQQRAAEKQRGVPFQLTYSEWASIWHRSGRLQQRGIGTGRHVIGRRYASSNVEIVSFEENIRQGVANRKARQALTAPSTDWIT